MFMPCFNMPEAAMAIVGDLHTRIGKNAVDVFLVDNGSQISHAVPDIPPTARTSPQGGRVTIQVIRLPVNVQTTHAFNVAKSVARGIAFTGGFQYEAAWLWTTSLVLPEPSDTCPQDILSPLLVALRNEEDLGAVVPALTGCLPSHFNPAFYPMIHSPERARSTAGPLEPARMVDILGLLVREPLFSDITEAGFQPTILRAWGLDIDLCATLQRRGFRIAVHHGVTLQKRNGIGYAMQRMSEDSKTRNRRSVAEMNAFFERKYGAIMFRERQEAIEMSRYAKPRLAAMRCQP